MIFPPLRYIDDISMDADIEGIPFNVRDEDGYYMELSWTGTARGVLSIQTSATAEVWTELSEGSINVNNAGNTAINISQKKWHWTRVTYTRTSGTGTLRVTICS